ncbi:MAG: hypothetical protein QM791_20120 [Ferruginibacter sp.]
MTKTEILIVGRHPQIMETVLRLVNNNGEWNGTMALTDEAAIELFQQRDFEIVLLCSGIAEESERKLRSLFTYQEPGIIIIQHFGGGSGLLNNEILEALDKKAKENKPVVFVKDGL